MQTYELEKIQIPREIPFVPCMIVVQARMRSTRLPGKVMMQVLERPLLAYLVERLRRVRFVQGICIATSQRSEDDVIAAFCDHEGLHCIRGSEEDVLSRYQAAVDAFGLEAVVRITGDCPLIDPSLIERGVVAFLTNNSLDYLSNTLKRTFPRGMDFECIRAETLKTAYFEAISSSDREHVTSSIIAHPERFSLANITQVRDDSKYRLTVDTPEDFELVRRLIEALYRKMPEFALSDILKLLQAHPDWVELNAHVVQKTV